jgi:hypothetical protein
MTRRSLLVAAALVFAAMSVEAEFFCKRYDFVADKWIRLGARAGDIEIQDVQFEIPSYIGPKKLDIKRNEAAINLKNYGSQTLRIKIAIALFDEQGNLVACGATGSKVGGTSSGKTESFYVTFDYVHSKIASSKIFYLTVETEPLQ